MTMHAPSTIAAFGKLPDTGDFVSRGAGSAAGQALQKWLQAENDDLAAKGCHLPSNPVRFVFRDRAGATVTGALAPSHDRVGRGFPLTVYAHIDPSRAMPGFSALPAAYDPFVDGAAQAVQNAQQLQVATLDAHISTLPLPEASELEDAQRWTHEALGVTPAAVLLEQLFGPLANGVQYHGLNMFRSACRQVHGRDPGLASIIVECHAGDDVQVAFWLCMAEGLLGWSAAPPSFFWTDVASEDSRLLIALGSPPPGVLHYLAEPTATAERLWPTRTTSSSAVEAGRKALGLTQHQVLDPPASTAAELVAALAQP